MIEVESDKYYSAEQIKRSSKYNKKEKALADRDIDSATMVAKHYIQRNKLLKEIVDEMDKGGIDQFTMSYGFAGTDMRTIISILKAKLKDTKE